VRRGTALDHARGEIRRDDRRALAGGQQGQVAGAGSHVEHLLPGRDGAGVEQRLGGGQGGLRDHGVVAQLPGVPDVPLVVSEVAHGRLEKYPTALAYTMVA